MKMLIFVCHLEFFCNCSNTKSKRNGYKMSVVGGKFGFPLGFLDGDRYCGEKSKSKRNQGRTQNGFEEWCGDGCRLVEVERLGFEKVTSSGKRNLPYFCGNLAA
jgi:hypothetical protein